MLGPVDVAKEERLVFKNIENDLVLHVSLALKVSRLRYLIASY